MGLPAHSCLHGAACSSSIAALLWAPGVMSGLGVALPPHSPRGLSLAAAGPGGEYPGPGRGGGDQLSPGSAAWHGPGAAQRNGSRSCTAHPGARRQARPGTPRTRIPHSAGSAPPLPGCSRCHSGHQPRTAHTSRSLPPGIPTLPGGTGARRDSRVLWTREPRLPPVPPGHPTPCILQDTHHPEPRVSPRHPPAATRDTRPRLSPRCQRGRPPL